MTLKTINPDPDFDKITDNYVFKYLIKNSSISKTRDEHPAECQIQYPDF